MFTTRGNSIYDEAGKVFCTLPTSTIAARKVVIAENKARIMDIPNHEGTVVELVGQIDSLKAEYLKRVGDILALQGDIDRLTAALNSMEARNGLQATEIVVLKALVDSLTAPVVITPPPVVVEPPPVITTPPIIAGQVTSLNEATSQLRAGKSIRLKPGVYVGALDLRYVNGPVTLDATGVDLTGYVHLQDTKGLTLNGLNLTATVAGVVGGPHCDGVTLDGVSVTGEHKGIGTAGYSNIVGFDFSYNVGALAILRCKATNVLTGVIASSEGDFRLEDTEVWGFGDDGFKANLTSINGVKNILRNTFGIPVETGREYHSDMGQLTSIGANSAVEQFNLRVEDNVGFENHDLSSAAVQGINNFPDGSAYGRLWVNASVKRNLIMCSNAHALSFYNLKGGVFEDNTVINARVIGENAPWITYGSMPAMEASVTKTRNLSSLADSQYRTLFNWDGVEQPKNRADVIRMLTRR